MFVPLAKKLAGQCFTGPAASFAARRRFAGIRQDDDNVTDPNKILDLAAGHQVVSFDFFDTIVTRSIALDEVHEKTAAFGDRYIRGDDGPLPTRLLADCRFRFQKEVKNRGKASKTAFRNEIDLADVFDGALAPYIADQARRKQAVDALIGYEVETEKQVLTVDPAMPPVLRALRDAGKKLILVSDMYLDERHMHAILADLGIDQLFDAVFVSATVGVTKASGLMFEHLDTVLAIGDTPRVHFGDSWNNDLVQPRRMGWDAYHYFRRDHEQRKATLEIEANLGGTSRKKLFRALERDFLSGDRDDTHSLVGAAFSIFSRRVLSTAVQGDYDRILFLTRDATIFHDIVTASLDASGAAGLRVPDLGHFAFSRRKGVVLNLPAPDDPAWAEYLQFNVQWLTGRESTVSALLAAFAVSPHEADLAATEDGLTFDGDAVGDLRLSEVENRPKLAAALHRPLAWRQENVKAYLDQQGIFDRNEKIMLVDIGYSGTAAKALSEQMFLREADGRPVSNRISMMLMASNRYYHDNRRRLHPRVRMYPAAIVNTADPAHRALAANFAWLEPFTVDRSRGSLRDYERDGSGVMVPQFAAPSAAIDGAPDRENLIAAARAYETALRGSRLREADGDRLMIERFVAHFLNPRRAAIADMSRISHHAGLAEVDEVEPVGRIRPHRFLNDLRACHKQDKWLQGSLRASGFGLLIPLFNWAIAMGTR